MVEDSISNENWPSSTDCLRAWGWLEAKERVSVRARGEGTSGDVGAAIKVSSPEEELDSLQLTIAK